MLITHDEAPCRAGHLPSTSVRPIWERTKAAAKARGPRLGTVKRMHAAHAARFEANLLPIIREVQAAGLTSCNATRHRERRRGELLLPEGMADDREQRTRYIGERMKTEARHLAS
jgi:hypothetical protein